MGKCVFVKARTSFVCFVFEAELYFVPRLSFDCVTQIISGDFVFVKMVFDWNKLIRYFPLISNIIYSFEEWYGFSRSVSCLFV